MCKWKLDGHLSITLNENNRPLNREVIIVIEKKERWEMFGFWPHCTAACMYGTLSLARPIDACFIHSYTYAYRDSIAFHTYACAKIIKHTYGIEKPIKCCLSLIFEDGNSTAVKVLYFSTLLMHFVAWNFGLSL